jgi:hypothetical protein
MVHRLTAIVLMMMLALTTSVLAQPTWGLDQGSILIGGSASYYEASGEVQTFSTKKSWEMFPYAYYCVWPNLALGGTVLMSSETRSGFESTTLMGIGPGAYAFIADSTMTAYPFVGLNLYYAFLSQVDLSSSSGNTRSLHGFSLELTVGGTYMVHPNVGITGMIYYQGQQLFENGDLKGGNRVGYRIGLTGFIF